MNPLWLTRGTPSCALDQLHHGLVTCRILGVHDRPSRVFLAVRERERELTGSCVTFGGWNDVLVLTEFQPSPHLSHCWFAQEGERENDLSMSHRGLLGNFLIVLMD